MVEVPVGQNDRTHRIAAESRKQSRFVAGGIYHNQRTAGFVAREEAVRIERAQHKALHSHYCFLFFAPASGIDRRASKTPLTERTALRTFVS